MPRSFAQRTKGLGWWAKNTPHIVHPSGASKPWTSRVSQAGWPSWGGQLSVQRVDSEMCQSPEQQLPWLHSPYNITEALALKAHTIGQKAGQLGLK